MNVSGILLKHILENPEESLGIWAKLKLTFFAEAYGNLYSKINKFYNQFSKLPTIEELETITRDPSSKASLVALSKLDVPTDIDIEIIFEALLDEYTQKEALDKIDSLIDDITLLSSDEIKENISNIALYLDEKTYNNERMFRMNDFMLSATEEISTRIPLGFNASLDYKSGGMQNTDLVLIGGMRGSGKSIVGVNIVCNQFLEGYVGLFFSIEMPGSEIYQRSMSILSGVSHDRIRNNRLEQGDYNKLAEVQKDFYEDSDSLYEKFLIDRDYPAFERHLVREKKLLEDRQLIIVDNQELTVADIDLHIHKAKAQFGGKLQLVVVDYVNQIVPIGEDMYDWKTQVNLSKNLKNLARKHEVCVVSPYQIDKGGEARFAKGLLDAADIALNLTAQESSLKFTTTKCRGFASMELESPINWDTLRIEPDEFSDNIQPTEEDMAF